MQNSLVIQRALDKIADSLSRLNHSSFGAGLIVFFSATQLGFHFWPGSALIYGIRIDYLSPTIYFLDILIIIYLLIKRFENLRIYDLRIVAPLLLTNLLYSANPLSTLFWSLHLILYLSFISTIKFEHLRIWDLRLVLTLFLFFQTILALAQVYLGHSVGGLMYYLGERGVAVGAPNIALGTFFNSVVLRAYGTFSHPNVLAGWSVVVLLIIIQLHKQQNKFENWRIWDLRLLLPLSLASLLIFLTQSRSAAISLFGLIIPFYLLKNIKIRLLYFVLILYTLYSIPNILSPPRSDLSLSQRLDLHGLSLKVISQYPIFGTGAQASISTYPSLAPNFRLFQPDHNSFTLLLSWFGLFGTLALLYFLRSYSIRHTLYSILPITPLLLLDHYFLTSPQGLFILILYFQLNYSHVQTNRQ